MFLLDLCRSRHPAQKSDRVEAVKEKRFIGIQRKPAAFSFYDRQISLYDRTHTHACGFGHKVKLGY